MSSAPASVTATELLNCTLLRIDGELNGSFDPAAVAGRSGVIVFDMGGVHRITSQGVRQWIAALKGLEADYYCFINCRPVTIDQFNLIRSFRQAGEVVSFFAPFRCPSCARTTEHLLDLRYLDVIEPPRLPEVMCPGCGARAEFDEVPEVYFKHVLSAPTPRPPPAVNAAIGGEAVGAPRRRFELKKEVDESATYLLLSGRLDGSAYFKRVAEAIDGVAVLDASELEEIDEAAVEGFARLLDELGDRALIARVPSNAVDSLGRVLRASAGQARVVSFLLPLRCTCCRLTVAAEVMGERALEILRIPGATEMCPRCLHPLTPRWTPDLADRAARLTIERPPPEVHAYLRTHPPAGPTFSGGGPGPLSPDRLLLGKYEILQPLGQGGMGEVFLARHIGPESFEKLVVLKRIRRDRITDPQSRDLFLMEARIAGRLSHANIVQVFDLERVDDEYLMSMEYVNGIDLARALELSRVHRLMWPVEICCRIVSELCDALQSAHSYRDDDGRPAPIIHRDVSPSNILLSTEGAVKLTDFGIARAADERAELGAMRGKAGYAAPEQCAGSRLPTDERTDIYAAGVVLYECLTLRTISATPTMPPQSSAPAWRANSPPQLCVARSGVPPLLQDIFERATQPDPAQRYRTARDLGRDLARIGRLVSETTVADDMGRWVRRMVALRLGTEGHTADAMVTMHTGSAPNLPAGATTDRDHRYIEIQAHGEPRR